MSYHSKAAAFKSTPSTILFFSFSRLWLFSSFPFLFLCLFAVLKRLIFLLTVGEIQSSLTIGGYGGFGGSGGGCSGVGGKKQASLASFGGDF